MKITISDIPVTTSTVIVIVVPGNDSGQSTSSDQSTSGDNHTGNSAPGPATEPCNDTPVNDSPVSSAVAPASHASTDNNDCHSRQLVGSSADFVHSCQTSLAGHPLNLATSAPPHNIDAHSSGHRLCPAKITTRHRRAAFTAKSRIRRFGMTEWPPPLFILFMLILFQASELSIDASPAPHPRPPPAILSPSGQVAPVV